MDGRLWCLVFINRQRLEQMKARTLKRNDLMYGSDFQVGVWTTLGETIFCEPFYSLWFAFRFNL